MLGAATGPTRYLHDGVMRRAFALRHADGLTLDAGDGEYTFTEPVPGGAEDDSNDPSKVVSPVAGVLVSLSVAVGDAVSADQTLGTVEAMKMETRLVAQADGTVSAVHAGVGDSLDASAVVFELTLDASE